MEATKQTNNKLTISKDYVLGYDISVGVYAKPTKDFSYKNHLVYTRISHKNKNKVEYGILDDEKNFIKVDGRKVQKWSCNNNKKYWIDKLIEDDKKEEPKKEIIDEEYENKKKELLKKFDEEYENKKKELLKKFDEEYENKKKEPVVIEPVINEPVVNEQPVTEPITYNIVVSKPPPVKMKNPELIRGKFWNNTEYVRCKDKPLWGSGRCDRCDCYLTNTKYNFCYDCNTTHIPREKTFLDKKSRYFQKTKYERPDYIKETKLDKHQIRDNYKMSNFEYDLINKRIDFYKDKKDDGEIGAYIYEDDDEIIIEPDLKKVRRMIWNKIDDKYESKVSRKDKRLNFIHIFRPYEFEKEIDVYIDLITDKMKLFKVSKKELEKMDSDDYNFEENEIIMKKKIEEIKNYEW